MLRSPLKIQLINYRIFTPGAIEKRCANKQRFLLALYPREQQVFLMGSKPNLILRDRTPNNHN